jgi:hypothetical protein
MQRKNRSKGTAKQHFPKRIAVFAKTEKYYGIKKLQYSLSMHQYTSVLEYFIFRNTSMPN